jgi:hypothetical protein
VAGYSLHMLEHLQPSEDTLNFDVIRRSDHKDLQFKLQVTGDKTARLTCTNCDSPATEMVRSF